MSPCTHLTLTLRPVSNALCCIRLWWMEIWLQPESTKAWYVPPWYSKVYGTAWLDRGQPPGSRGPGPAIPPPSWDSGPESAPDPASPAGRPRPYRRPSGRRMGKGLPERVRWSGSGLWPPPHAGGKRSAWPFPLRGGARGATGTRDLGAGIGREREGDGGKGREREREIEREERERERRERD